MLQFTMGFPGPYPYCKMRETLFLFTGSENFYIFFTINKEEWSQLETWNLMSHFDMATLLGTVPVSRQYGDPSVIFLAGFQSLS